MNKLLLIPFLLSGIVYGQASLCDQNVINTNNSLPFAMIPDTIVNLPHAEVRTTYETTLHFKVPVNLSDISPILSGVVNYGIVNEINGLPEGFQWECISDPQTSTITAGQWGCFRIYSNTPIDENLIGTHPLTVNVTYNITLVTPFGSIPSNSTMNTSGYKIVIYQVNSNDPDSNDPDPNNPDPNNPDPNNPDPNNPDPNDSEEPWTSIETVSGGIITIYPNPAKENITLYNIEQIQKIKIYNVKGELIEVLEMNGTKQTNISINNFADGTYLIHLIGDYSNQTIRLIKY